jgi:hypothetical protein
MAKPKYKTGNKLADKTLEDYELALQTACANAIVGNLTKGQLRQSLEQISGRYLSMLYTIGGGNLSNARGKKWLEKEQKIHKRSAAKLANDVFNGRYQDNNANTNQPR